MPFEPGLDPQPIAAVVNTRTLAKRCIELEQQLDGQTREENTLRTEMEAMRRRSDGHQELIAFGENELRRKKENLLNDLRAIVHHSGERIRVEEMERRLASSEITPDHIERMRLAISQELRALYPTRRQSRPIGSSFSSRRRPHDFDSHCF